MSELDIRYLLDMVLNFDLLNMVLNLMSELDIRYLLNMVLNFDLRARYSVSTEYGAEFRSQSSIFGIY